MKVSYNWLQEYFENPLPQPTELATLLNIRAFEVEEVVEKDGDSIFEIKVTPDRAPDCLSHDGIAREVSVHTKQPLVNKAIDQINGTFESAYNIFVEEKSCVRYMAREIKNVVVKESPLELKLKLEAIDQRSINTIVDITNIVMYEIGQPMHAFDIDKLTGNTITVGVPKDTAITTLDNKEVELTQEDLTIQDEVDNLAIAGVKGGKKGEVDQQTKNILLESANFFPTKVRSTSKRTGIQTDSSKRFENGLTPELAQKAIERASFYISKYASNEQTQYSNILDVYPRPASPYYTGVSLEEICNALGVNLTQTDIEDILTRAGFEHQYVNTKSFAIEEIKKLIGTPHNTFPSLTYDAPRSFDCTTLTAYVFAHGGKSIPRLTVDQLFFGKEITKEELEPGDLIFSKQDDGEIKYETINFLPGLRFDEGVDHVGMYVGDDTVIHTSRYKGGVVEEKLSTSENFKTIVGYRRIVAKDEMRFAIKVPSIRLDIKASADLIEEIGRIYGYEHIVPVEPKLTKQENEISLYDKLNTVRSHLVDIGFDEVITYSFQKKGDVSVVKPIAKDKGYLRSDLVKGLSDALDLNFKNKELFATEIIKIFEIGHVFVEEIEKVILGLGVKSSNKKRKSKVVLEETLAYLSEKINFPFDVMMNDTQEVIEIDLTPMVDRIHKTYNSIHALAPFAYTPFSLYPYMTRDIAVWASGSKTKEDVEEIITTLATQLLVRYDLFDTYASDGKTSYAYRLVFQSSERTLTDDEINPIMDSIYSKLKSDSDFEIR
jgi:phenylalanyl-tRNA synthetase beta subunit